MRNSRFCLKAATPESLAVDVGRRMSDRMRPSDPATKDIWIGEGVALGYCPLDIPDLDACANQPTSSTDSHYTIVINQLMARRRINLIRTAAGTARVLKHARRHFSRQISRQNKRGRI